MSVNASVIESLGRRLAERRAAAGLGREELAERAGVPLGFVAFLEEQTGESMREAIARLAGALGTTAEELLSEVAPPPSGRPHLEELSEEESLALLAPGGVGRLAFQGRYGLSVLPVNYRLSDGAVVFRTSTGGSTDEDLRTGVADVEYQVAFEVDEVDTAGHSGWSVLVQGSLHHVTAEEEQAAAATGVEPWAGGDRRQYLRIKPSRVTGRRIVLS
ncbi:helix-turn-helix domain-containing protein [Nonomuraea pusilla]|uniref:Helix-turn-helix domain-containing protein n=1 Tax=Nonomuraea pusilla TaxID=46177 RepID=A0A1H8IA50_9ACTN|nr:pyridoxamine 5'-phosphate oxidase family protein [Nonomuraea pusilla]SEN64926.1 Helix-turn-helix domain-containing protein [Nonomuraea pusilla]